MKINVVDLADFTERNTLYGRLDAEFVDPDMLRLEKRLKTHYQAHSLSALPSSEPHVYSRPAEPSSTDISYVAIDNIDALDGFVFHQDVPEEELPSRAKFVLAAFDILISNVRPERGAVGILIPSQDKAIGSSGLTVIRTASKISRNVLFTYLRTEAARTQLVRRSRGSMYPSITKDDVADIVVPKVGAEIAAKISKMVDLSLVARVEFTNLRAQQKAYVDGYLQVVMGEPPPDSVLDISPVRESTITRTSASFSPQRQVSLDRSSTTATFSLQNISISMAAPRKFLPNGFTSSEAKAEEVRQKLLAMQKEYLIELGDAVIAVKDSKGNIKLN